MFLAVAIGSLFLGLSQAGLTSIYISIGASVAATAFLVASLLRAGARRPQDQSEASPLEPAAAPPAVDQGAEVTALPREGTYHRPGCRFVDGRRDAEPMSRAAVGERGYRPCAMCKPG